jgi:RNA polymerase sigma factor (sigma-70 family)
LVGAQYAESIQVSPTELSIEGAILATLRFASPGGSDATRQRFERLVAPYLPEAYALARALTGNRADAEDVVQDACLRALRAIGGVAIANPRAWMLTIVHNTAFTWLGKNRSAAIVAVEDLELAEQSSPHGGDQNTPELAVIAKSEAAHLEAAIAALPAVFRETLLLRDVEGLNYKEIAEVTGVPIGTVMSRLTRARSRLMTLLAEAGT